MGGQRQSFGSIATRPAHVDRRDRYGVLIEVILRPCTNVSASALFGASKMSTAVASGVAGLMYSRFPELTVAQAREVIRNTAKGSGWDRRRGYGYIDPLAIVELDRIECDLEITGATMQYREPGTLAVTIANRGVLDATGPP